MAKFYPNSDSAAKIKAVQDLTVRMGACFRDYGSWRNNNMDEFNISNFPKRQTPTSYRRKFGVLHITRMAARLKTGATNAGDDLLAI